MKKKYIVAFNILFLAAAVSLSSCSKKEEKAAAPDSTTVAPAPEPAKPDKVFNVLATVTEVDKDKGRITIDHEKMEGYMDAMEMPFKVTNPAVFDKVQVGTK